MDIIVDKYSEKYANRFKSFRLKLRDIDKQELEEMEAITGTNGLSAMSSDEYTSYIGFVKNGITIGVFGISNKPISFADTTGYCIWFIGHKEIDTSYSLQKVFLRYSLYFIRKWLNDKPVLFNFIHKDNMKTKRWLNLVGAKISRECIIGNFQSFIVERKW